MDMDGRLTPEVLQEAAREMTDPKIYKQRMKEEAEKNDRLIAEYNRKLALCGLNPDGTLMKGVQREL